MTAVALVAAACSSRAAPTPSHHILRVSVETGFMATGPRTCQSDLGGHEVSVLDADAKTLSSAAFPAVGAWSGPSGVKFGTAAALDVGTCSGVTATLARLPETTPYTVDLGAYAGEQIGTLDYTNDELQADRWSVTIEVRMDPQRRNGWIVTKAPAPPSPSP